VVESSVDTVAPTVEIAGLAEGALTNDNTPQLTLSSDEPATFRGSLDVAGWNQWASSWTAPALTDGAHAVSVKAIDGAGNESAVAARNFTVDTVAPRTTITSGPQNGATISTASTMFAFTADEPGTVFDCRVDAGDWQACISPYGIASLANGAHSFTVRATDGAQNTGDPAARSFTVAVQGTPPPADSTLPQTKITKHPVRATDAAGNADATPAIWKWTVTRARR
jgi:predicted phage tail protein